MVSTQPLKSQLHVWTVPREAVLACGKPTLSTDSTKIPSLRSQLTENYSVQACRHKPHHTTYSGQFWGAPEF